MVDSGLLDKKFIFYDDDGYEVLKEGESFEMTCFEDIYVSTRNGVWINQIDSLIQFRMDAARTYGEPNEALSRPESTDEILAASEDVEDEDEDETEDETKEQDQVMIQQAAPATQDGDDEGEESSPISNVADCTGEDCEPKASGIITFDEPESKKKKKKSRGSAQSYCRRGGKSNARIRIFQRSATFSLRKFINLDEVVKLAQSYTRDKVEIVSVNASTSIAEQIKLFNEFDVLITPHGSHLANGIFTVRPQTKAVVEVSPFAFDRVFYSNYIPALGFAHYIMSTGHLTPQQRNTGGDHCVFKSVSSFDELSCKKQSHAYPGKYPQQMFECPTRFHTRMCDTLVDISILQSQLDDLFSHVLCK